LSLGEDRALLEEDEVGVVVAERVLGLEVQAGREADLLLGQLKSVLDSYAQRDVNNTQNPGGRLVQFVFRVTF